MADDRYGLPDDPDAARRFFRSKRRGRPVDPPRPGPGQESVWDYPRPPRLEPERRPVRIELFGEVIAESQAALRVCETASPPVVYLPPADVVAARLAPNPQRSFCEWKGAALYWDGRSADGELRTAIAWGYPDPTAGFEALRDHVAFYPGRVDGCWLGDERVRPQPGDFYGGWITDELLGPFKGEPGTGHW